MPSLASAGKCPGYEELIGASRKNSAENYAFHGTKLDISKEIFGNSIFTVSNTERGLSVNYSVGGISRVFSASVFSDGSVLGKISPAPGHSGMAVSCMRGPETQYFDVGLEKALKRAAFSVKAVNPSVEIPSLEIPGGKLSACFQHLRSSHSSLRGTLQKFSGEISRAISEIPSGSGGLRSCMKEGAFRACRLFRGGVFSATSVLEVAPSLHLGVETVFSLARKEPGKETSGEETGLLRGFSAYAREAAATCIVSKAFETWRLLGIYHTSGNAGFFAEKRLDEAVSLHSELSVDWRKVLKTGPFWESVGFAVGTVIRGPGSTTHVTAGSNGVVTASSDIPVGDGAVLNLSTQVSTGSPLLGIGFTFTS
ncbi:uncharacterized protein NEMAJ01_1871 [Nematocida major]|uniref:uncharacterized protein n=1 Tax=Nematocida major TaxID=1912982 RepID=UPI0020087308|nr:uncharacterized protein NEMAJ01_1871 [Nematocida major]KAH9386975.1 hypothetical protein NEMAJ01_1871 [Nematocida major]